MKRFYLYLCILWLSACAAQPAKLPTSERLVGVKGMRTASLRNAMLSQNLELGSPVYLRLFKKETLLEAWVKDGEDEQYSLFKKYPICNYSGKLGPKLKEGDRQAPEGFYWVGAQQMNPWSQHHLSFDLGYPNAYDAALGRTGSHLMVHGGCKSDGCYALTDDVIEDVYLMVEASIANGHGVPVHIFPFRMNESSLVLNQDARWSGFWENLKQGYDAFEETHIPPQIGIEKESFSTISYLVSKQEPQI
ncbi:MAG: murein L,D-transpeptidase [Alphaproteobacteria bacterium]|nr:murein L,D-transpeptidase [Alphaproteobacteria bacterium]